MPNIRYMIDENINGCIPRLFIKFIIYGIITFETWLMPSDKPTPVDFIDVGNDYICNKA